MRITATLTAALSLLVLPAAAACGSPAHPDAGRPQQATVAATLGTSPRPGSPAFCGMLARSSALRALPAALTEPSSSGRQVSSSTLRSAAADLSRIGPTAPASLRLDFGSAASALAQMANQDQWSAATVNAVSVSLTRLGQEVQGPCRFPVR